MIFDSLEAGNPIMLSRSPKVRYATSTNVPSRMSTMPAFAGSFDPDLDAVVAAFQVSSSGEVTVEDTQQVLQAGYALNYDYTDVAVDWSDITDALYWPAGEPPYSTYVSFQLWPDSKPVLR